jgi:hypothetical protein
VQTSLRERQRAQAGQEDSLFESEPAAACVPTPPLRPCAEAPALLTVSAQPCGSTRAHARCGMAGGCGAATARRLEPGTGKRMMTARTRLWWRTALASRSRTPCGQSSPCPLVRSASGDQPQRLRGQSLEAAEAPAARLICALTPAANRRRPSGARPRAPGPHPCRRRTGCCRWGA